jgi:SAM-dependent methyltransferase
MDRRLDRTSDVYAGEYSSPAFQQHHRLRIHWMCRQARGQRVLDVGCSQGIVSILLAREGLDVVGVDVEPELIRQAEVALASEVESVQARAKFLATDVLSDDLDLGRFDTIIAGEIVEHLVQPERLIRRCYDLLNEDGRLVVTVPFGLHPFPDHKRTYYLTTLVKTLSPYFAIRDIELIHEAAGADSPAPIVGAVTEKRSEPLPEEWDRAREWLEFSERGFIAAEERYTSQIVRLQEREEQLRRRSEDQADRLRVTDKKLRAIDAELTKVRGNVQDLERRLAESASRVQDLERELAESASRVQALSGVEKALRAACRDRDRAIRQLARRLAMMEDATSYRLGLLIVRALRRPYLLLVLPFQVIGLLSSAAVRKLRGKERRREQRMVELRTPLAPIPQPGTAAGAGSPVAGSTTVATVAAPPSATEAADGERTRLLLSGSYEFPRAVKDLVVAAILDEFTLECLRPECRIVTFRPDNWQGILERERPHFLFVESAWKGNGGSWEYRVASYKGGTPGGPKPLRELVAWCHRAGIPTVFWNKEDPLHFAQFLDAAKLFEVVFTSDANCVPQYRRALGHDRVYPLPFAAQPRIHNPIRVPDYREKDVCFAGSYYRNRHPQRRKELEWLLGAGLDFGLEIYDRAHGRTGDEPDAFLFPKRLQEAIVGGVPYREMVQKYKQYKVFLNVNSVTDSPTMCSRRVFELLACGTPVVSTPAEGIERLLGREVVQIVSSPEEARAALGRLLENDTLRERLGLAGQRLIAGGHSYAHRLQEVATRLGFAVEPPRPPRVSVIAWANGDGGIADAIDQLVRQEEIEAELIFVSPKADREAAQEMLARSRCKDRAFVLAAANPAEGATWWKDALMEASGEFVALFSPEDYYGPWYLADLLWALYYSHADAVGKAAYYAIEKPEGQVRLVGEGQEYSYVDSVLPAATLARRELMRDLGHPGSELHELRVIRSFAAAGARIFSTDRFNYAQGAGPRWSGHTDI